MFQQEMREHIDQVKTVLSTDLRAAVDSLEKKIKALSLTSEEESTDIRQQLERTNKKFSNSIQALDEIVYNQTSSIKGELSETRNKLQQDTRSLREQVLQELDKRFSMLKDAKVSKDDIAEVLLELGLRLKGTELVPELKKVIDNGIDNGVDDHLLLLKQSQTLE
jgi:molecular chaperone DnaK (HSP70)